MHWCKWCKARRSGAHRKHRDNPNYKSKMQMKNEELMPSGTPYKSITPSAPTGTPYNKYEESVPVDEWEEDYERLYEAGLLNDYGSLFKQGMKDFIRKTLKHQATQLIEVVEGMKRPVSNSMYGVTGDLENSHRNAALSDVLSELKKLI